MNTETNTNRSPIDRRVQFWKEQGKMNRALIKRMRQLYTSMGQIQKAIRTTNERLARLAGYSGTSRKMIDTLKQQSHSEIGRMKAELDEINVRLEEVQKRLDRMGGRVGPFSFLGVSGLTYAAFFLSILSTGLAIWCLIGR